MPDCGYPGGYAPLPYRGICCAWRAGAALRSATVHQSQTAPRRPRVLESRALALGTYATRRAEWTPFIIQPPCHSSHTIHPGPGLRPCQLDGSASHATEKQPAHVDRILTISYIGTVVRRYSGTPAGSTLFPPDRCGELVTRHFPAASLQSLQLERSIIARNNNISRPC